jgi:hypothetical protein
MNSQGRSSSTIRFIGEANRSSDQSWLFAECLFVIHCVALSGLLVSFLREAAQHLSRETICLSKRPNQPLQPTNAPPMID